MIKASVSTCANIRIQICLMKLVRFSVLGYICLQAGNSQRAVVHLHSTMSLVPTTLHIDLTSEAEHCALCSTILGEGSGKASLVYVLKDCRCVSLTVLISYHIIDGRKVICGLCVQFPGPPPFLPCQHADHVDLGWQRPLRLYNLKCAICLDGDDATRIALICGKFTPYTTVPANSQGHVYCRTCILWWARSNSDSPETNVACPSCRNSRTKVWRLSKRDHIVRPAQRGVEIAPPYSNL